MNVSIRAFATIRICSPDVKKSRDWYQAFFGVAPVEELENFASFRLGGTCLDIALADEKSPLSTGGSVGYWLVDDLDQALEKAKQLGASIYRGPLRVNEIKRTIVQIKDPQGNVFGLEGTWE